MIDILLIEKFYNVKKLYKLEKRQTYYAIHINNHLIIYLYDDDTEFFNQPTIVDTVKRKNCFVYKSLFYNIIYIHKNLLIKHLRNKQLNCILNNV